MAHLITKVHVSGAFTKAFRKIPKHVQQLAIKKDQIFRDNAFDPRLSTHKLKGALEGYHSYSINREYRILFGFINSHEVIYYDVGTHSIYEGK